MDIMNSPQMILIDVQGTCTSDMSYSEYTIYMYHISYEVYIQNTEYIVLASSWTFGPVLISLEYPEYKYLYSEY